MAACPHCQSTYRPRTSQGMGTPKYTDATAMQTTWYEQTRA